MIATASRACHACQAWGTPQCVQCPTNVARWRRAICRVAWRRKITLLYTALGVGGTVLLMVR